MYNLFTFCQCNYIIDHVLYEQICTRAREMFVIFSCSNCLALNHIWIMKFEHKKVSVLQSTHILRNSVVS